MTTIRRQTFVQELGKEGGAINIHELGKALRAELGAAGVSRDALRELAGDDAQVRGQAELGRLFALVDRFDTDGSPHSFVALRRAQQGSTSVALAPRSDKPGEEETLSGRLYALLKEEVARHRHQSREMGVIHLGMRRASRREVSALERVQSAAQGGVLSIRADQAGGKLLAAGQLHSLTRSAELAVFAGALAQDGMPSGRAGQLAALLAEYESPIRANIARLALALHRIGEGTLRVSRLVFSGHGDGHGIGDDAYSWLPFAAIERVARLFPEGAQQIEHVAVSACFSGYPQHVELFRRAFGGLKSYWGYVGFSPLAESGAPWHLQVWEGLTDGDDPSRVDASTHHASVATWNRVDGYQHPHPARSRADIEAEVARRAPAYHRYASGIAPPHAARQDPELDRYYESLVDLIYHPSLDAPRRADLEAHRQQVLELRHPESTPATHDRAALDRAG